MSTINYTTLYGCLADLPDGRHAQGKRYEWLYLGDENETRKKLADRADADVSQSFV